MSPDPHLCCDFGWLDIVPILSGALIIYLLFLNDP